MVELAKALRRSYRMRSLGENGLNTVVGIPPAVVEREASIFGRGVVVLIKIYRAVAHYDHFEGILYTFEEAGIDEPL